MCVTSLLCQYVIVSSYYHYESYQYQYQYQYHIQYHIILYHILYHFISFSSLFFPHFLSNPSLEPAVQRRPSASPGSPAFAASPPPPNYQAKQPLEQPSFPAKIQTLDFTLYLLMRLVTCLGLVMMKMGRVLATWGRLL